MRKVCFVVLSALFFLCSPVYAGGVMYLFAEGSRAMGSGYATADILTGTEHSYTYSYRRVDGSPNPFEGAVYTFHWLPGMPTSGNITVSAELRSSVTGDTCALTFIGCEHDSSTTKDVGSFGAGIISVTSGDFMEYTISNSVPIPSAAVPGTCWVSIQIDYSGILCGITASAGVVDFRTVKLSW